MPKLANNVWQLQTDEEYAAWMTRFRSAGYILSTITNQRARNKMHRASCSEVRNPSRAATRFGFLSLEDLRRETKAQPYLPRGTENFDCDKCTPNLTGATETRRDTWSVRTDVGGGSSAGLNVILGNEQEASVSTADGALPRFTKGFRPPGEFEGKTGRNAEGGTREVDVVHGGMVRRLDAEVTRVLNGEYSVGVIGYSDLAIGKSADDIAVIFEVKSNVRDRREALYTAIGQLFVYSFQARCQQDVVPAELVLVLPGINLPGDMNTHNALMSELGITVLLEVADGEFRTFQAESLQDWLTKVLRMRKTQSS